MQICARCGNPMGDEEPRCPKCGAPNAFISKKEFNQYIRERRKKKSGPDKHTPEKENQQDSDFAKEQERLRILYEKQEQQKKQQKSLDYQKKLQYYKEQQEKEEQQHRHRKNRKRTFVSVACTFFVAVLAVCISFAASGEGEKEAQTASTTSETGKPPESPVAAGATATPEPTAEPAVSGNTGIYKQTVMVYIVGSDLESDVGAASSDIEEMEESGLNPEYVNLLAYTGGSYSWSSDISSNKNSIYRITEGKKELVASEKQKNMGKPSTLTGFLDYCYDAYPADKYTLILWDHGAGPVWGFGADSLCNDDALELKELTKALGNSRLCQGNKLESVVFDACLMGSLEVASQLKPYANYLVASEDVIAGCGLDYSFLKELNQAGMDGSKLGSCIVDYYYEFYSSFSSSNENTMTCVDLMKIDAVENALNQLFSQVKDGSQHKKRRAERAKLHEYGAVDDISYDLVDVSRLAGRMEHSFGASAKAVQSAMKDAVVLTKTTGKNAKGLTVYYPYSFLPAAPDSMKRYRKFGFAKNYTKFIGDFSDHES